MIGNNLNLSDCWICTVLPRGMEFPLFGVPHPDWSREGGGGGKLDANQKQTSLYGQDLSKTIGRHFKLVPWNQTEITTYSGCMNPIDKTTSLEKFANDRERSQSQSVGIFDITKLKELGFNYSIRNTENFNFPSNIATNCHLAPGWWWLCGDRRARKSLPDNWQGHCTGGYIVPQEKVFNYSYPPQVLLGHCGEKRVQCRVTLL